MSIILVITLSPDVANKRALNSLILAASPGGLPRTPLFPAFLATISSLRGLPRPLFFDGVFLSVGSITDSP